jgi:N4-gp56 family major capsid protein
MATAWTDTGAGYLSNPTLSDEYRVALQSVCRFRQFCDVEAAMGKNRGDVYQWNIYGDTVDRGTTLDENSPMPETSFPISQGSVTVNEYGISVPYTGKLESLSEHDIRRIVFQVLRNDSNKALDDAAAAQFENALLRYVGTAATTYNLDTDGTATGNNNTALVIWHVKKIADTLQEKNVPTFDGENYMCIGRPSTFRPFRDELEQKFMYTQEGYNRVVRGEIGRYEGIRFVTQTNKAAETTNWATNSNKSDAAYFFGADTVTEAIACPEELRAKIADDYGRSKGIAWYYLGGFGITHGDATDANTQAQARILKWDSVA